MRKLNVLAVLATGALWQLGCAEPSMKPTTTAPKAPAAGGQSGSTTGGGAEVPLPATKATEEPRVETPAVEPKPAEEVKAADPAAAPTEPAPEAKKD